MVDVAVTHDRHSFEPSMRMLRKSRHNAAVVHAPAVLALKVLSDVATSKRGGGSEVFVALRIVIVVVHAEQEGIGGFPGDAERSCAFDNAIAHGKSNRRISHPSEPVPVNHNSRSSLTAAPSPSVKISPFKFRSPRTTWTQALRPRINIRLMYSPGARSVTESRASWLMTVADCLSPACGPASKRKRPRFSSGPKAICW